jgi:uncharacterized protein YebE (UPF0316 family)
VQNIVKRQNMIKYIIGFVVACILWIVVLSQVDMPEYRVYDCSMSEWHPDIPIDVKEECRKRRHQDWKKQNENTI